MFHIAAHHYSFTKKRTFWLKSGHIRSTEYTLKTIDLLNNMEALPIAGMAFASPGMNQDQPDQQANYFFKKLIPVIYNKVDYFKQSEFQAPRVLFLFTIFTQTMMNLVYPPKFCITIVSNFSWVLQSSQNQSKTMVVQNFGG